MSLIAEAPGFLQVFSDGSVKRFSPEIASASLELESSKGYKAKDVVIDPLKPITGRIFVPDILTTGATTRKLPVVVYFHGGGFCIGSTTWLGYHVFLGEFASRGGVIVVSIDYRLAPENRLPIAYCDGYSSLEWLAKSCNSDKWLEHADLSRVFLSGDSAGGNIAHNVAIKAMRKTDTLDGMKIEGLLLIHPYFGSEERSPKEMLDEEAIDVHTNDMFWKLSIPEGANRDYFGCNYKMAEVSEDEWSRFPNVVVYVAGLDFLMERGAMYVDHMRSKGVKGVELVEAKEENHVYHVYFPHSEATYLLQDQMASFINKV